MDQTSYLTAGGVRVLRTAEPFDTAELDEITRQVQLRPGGVLSSGMEYPGRYSRWHLAYIDPPVQIVARGRRISATALNQRGEVLLPAIAAALYRAAGSTRQHWQDERAGASADRHDVEVLIPESDEIFTEEQRSRRPTVFSALREIIAAFAGPDPHLGLYGAFGYDLAFQFEPVRQRHRPRRAAATWCCTCRTWSTPSTASGRPRPGSATTSNRRGHHRRAAAGLLPGRKRPRSRYAQPAGRPAAWQLRPRGGAGQGKVRPRRPVRGGAEPPVLRALHVPGRVLRAAPRAEPGAVRVLPQPRRGRVPGRRVTGDVRPGDRRPGRDLPDRGHHRARRGRDGGRRGDPDAAHLAEGRVGADHVHRRRPQRQVADLRAGQHQGHRPPSDRDLQPADPHRGPRRGHACAPASTRWTRS